MIIAGTDCGDKHIFPGVMQRAAWLVVVILLVFLPVQLLAQYRLSLPRYALWVDECIVLIALAVFIFALAGRGRCGKGPLVIFILLIFLVMLAVAAAIYNRNPFLPSFGGTLNLIKSLLPIPIFSLWVFGRRRVSGLYRIIHRIALLLCLVAIIQEIAFFAGWSVENLGVEIVDNRFYFLRAPSLLYHANAFGLYALLFFLLDFSLSERLRWQNLLLLLGVILSSSRVAWAALFLAFYYLLIIKSKKLILLFLPVVIILAVAFLPYFEVWKEKELTYQRYFRRYTVLKSIEIWKDYPLLGTGLGMYGGWVSPDYTSPIFEKYNFAPVWLKNLQEHRTLDCFWSQHLVEGGIFGVASFVGLLLLLWWVSLRAAWSSRDPFRRKMLTGLSSIPLVIGVYLFANILNVTAFILIYSILLGLLLVPEGERSKDLKSEAS